jgi:transcriptional regulator with XRE-family HTH domain
MTLDKHDAPRGRRIKALRKAFKTKDGRPLTQAGLASHLGVDGITVSRWERGGVVALKNIEKLAKFFNVDQQFISQGAKPESGKTHPAFNEYKAWLDKNPERMRALPEGAVEIIRTFPLRLPADYVPDFAAYYTLHQFMEGLELKKRGRSS